MIKNKSGYAELDGENSTTRATTAEQRHLLFKIWQETGDITLACKKSNVSRSTFYRWKSRFIKNGYEGLLEMRSHAPKNPRRTKRSTVDEIIQMKQLNPSWGKARISKRLNERHGHRVSSPNTVRKVLIDADLWNDAPREKKDKVLM